MSDEKTIIKEAIKEVKKTDEEILFAETTLGTVTVKPWTLGKLLKINPHLERLFQKLESKNVKITLDGVEGAIYEIYFAAFPELVEIMSISLEKTLDDLQEINLSDIVKIIYLIYKQNEDSLKNGLSLLRQKR